jgi:FixJ family two-component response regulator
MYGIVEYARCQKAREIVEAAETDPIGTVAMARGQRRVYIIDDDSDVRKSLHFLLAASLITAWPFAGAADFIDQLPGLSPAPIMLDVRMPGIDGLEVLAILKEREVNWPVIVMTAHGDVKIAVRAMKLGAIDFLEKPFQPDMLDPLLDFAFSIVDQNFCLLRARDDARSKIGELTLRESEVVRALIKGLPNKVVAHRLGLSVRTVEMHRSNAFAKLGLRSIAEIIALVRTANLTFDLA